MVTPGQHNVPFSKSLTYISICYIKQYIHTQSYGGARITEASILWSPWCFIVMTFLDSSIPIKLSSVT